MNDYIAECLEKFQDLPETFKEAIGGFQACAKLKGIEDKYSGISLGLVTVLLAVGELEAGDLPEYLKMRFDLSENQALAAARELMDQVVSPAFSASAPSSYKPTYGAEEIEEIFKHGILGFLSKDNDSLKVLNADIFKALDDDQEIESRLADNLRKNGELVCESKIRLGDKEVSGTISNWIADFVSRYGTDKFDELDMAQYMSSSDNANNISAPEKNNLRRILRLYYNFIFFPDSMDGVPMEKWEIFPLDVLAGDQGKGDDIESDQMLQLKQALSRYLEGSLEYKAISEEIKRLGAKK